MTPKMEAAIESRGAAEPETIQIIAVGRLLPSPKNPRVTFDEVTLRELADSIQAIGIQVPLLVRPLPGGSYEIVAGHRRFNAAALLGLSDVPCIVRNLDDAAAREIMVVENLQRDDLPPMEEAEAYLALKQILGSTQAIAARVGKPIAYVTRRLQLNSLGMHSRDAMRAQLITIDHALLLAKLGQEEQDKNLKWTLDTNAGIKTSVEAVIADVTKRKAQEEKSRYGAWEPGSVLELKNHIEQHTGRKLATAPWDLSATNLHADGVACLGCPSNTDDNRALFSDMSIDEATCANGACWAVKQDTFVHIQMAAAGDKTLRLSWKLSEAEPRMETVTRAAGVNSNGVKQGAYTITGPNEKAVLRQGQWVLAKKDSCPKVRKGVTVDFEESRYGDSGKGKPGEILQVCITPKCKVHPKAYETRAKRSNAGGYDPVAEKKKREENAIAVAIENKIRLALAKRAVEKVEKLPIEALRMLLLKREASEMPASVVADLKTASITGQAFARAVALLALYESEVEIREWQRPEAGRKEFLATLKMLGVDGQEARKPKLEPKVAKPIAKKPAKKKAGVR
ncbi:MAG TPA: ParB/RepB/Spo0J family partition protein [Acidobacteriaceae bacterium]|nr:ParB/RepB/Spo0J family partition protein [Acidobacteriaceae bacterium]